MTETQQQDVIREAFESLLTRETKSLGKTKFLKQKVDFVHKGTQVILPEGMSYEQAIEVLNLKRKEEEEVVSVFEEVEAFPLDGAYAFMRALQRKYGWATPAPTPGFFGPNPPTTVNLEIGFNEHTQIIWGGFKIPTIDGLLQTKVEWGSSPKFVIAGQIKKKHQEEIKEIARLTREIVKNESIYKGKAVRLRTDEEGSLSQEPPSFMDLSNVNPAELVFSENVQEQVETNLFTPIKKTEECRKNRVPLKRGVLFAGPYGTGKTLTANVTAKYCEDNGWTFLYLDRVSGLRDAILFARRYGPAVIFAEDIDRVVTGGRSVAVDDVLNNIDGIDSKHQELIIILTTNHIEKIEKAMLRPGRLDAVINVSPPDAKAAEKLIRIYGRNLIAKNENLGDAGKELEGQIPAVIREVVERSKLFAISRLKEGEELTLKGKDLAQAARGMKMHLDLLKPADKTLPTPQESLGNALSDIVEMATNKKGIFKKLDKIEDAVIN